MNRSTLLVVLCACCVGYAQIATRPEFEVASIRPSPPPDGRGMSAGCRGGPGTDDPALLTCRNVTISALVLMAYRVDPYQLSAPDWMSTTRFDVRIKVPDGTTRQQFAIMMQNLLADRFKLVARHESRELQRYELVVAKNGPKFKEYVELPPSREPQLPNEDAPRRPASPPRLDKDGYPLLTPGVASISNVGDRVRMHIPGMPMGMLASQLSADLHSPVIDRTSLTGKYDINLYWVEPPLIPNVEPDPGPTLEQALQDQLGLHLESKRGPVEVIVVEHAEKVPTAN